MITSNGRVLGRADVLFQTFNEMAVLWKRRGVDDVRINTSKLINLVRSYFHDVDRLKDFHGIELVDQAKQAAYAVKWILREQPVDFWEPDQDKVTEYHLTLNQYFALRVALAILRVRPSMLSGQFAELVVYTFKYRRIEEDMLLPLFELMRRISERRLVPRDDPL